MGDLAVGQDGRMRRLHRTQPPTLPPVGRLPSTFWDMPTTTTDLRCGYRLANGWAPGDYLDQSHLIPAAPVSGKVSDREASRLSR